MTNPDFIDDDADFGDPAEMRFGGISQRRWDRVREEVDCRDVVDILTGHRGSPCKCPFHGKDSSPSFYYFPENNTCFCFGCPDGDGYWDTLKVVTRSRDYSKVQALLWLEREFKLPPLEGDDPNPEEVLDLDEDPDKDPEALDEGPGLLVDVEDLRQPFLLRAPALVASQQDGVEAVALAQTLLERYFMADKHDDPAPLAGVLGADVIRRIIQLKHAGAR